MNSIRGFYASKAWANTRAAYRRYRGGLCEECLKQGKITAGIDVHHKIKLTPDNVNDPAISLSWDNLELLCRDCHAKEHTTKRYRIDSLGRVTPVSD